MDIQVQRNQIADKLQLTLDKMLEMDPKSFYYALIIKFYDPQNDCKTIGCIVGHYPKWFPQYGLFYRKSIYCLSGYGLATERQHIPLMFNELRKIHNINTSLIEDLFYGKNNISFDNDIKISQHSSLEVVIERWKLYIQRIRSGQYDQHIHLQN